MQQPEDAARQMIDQQVRAWEVLDPRVLHTLASVPREHFVPEAYRDVAFADTGLPIGHGQRMLPPQLVGRILQALAVERSDRVLEAGTGSGFLTACLAHLGGAVHSLEIHGDLAEAASRSLHSAAVANATVDHADALRLTDEDRYDVVALTASLPVYDARFERALRPAGRLFVVVGAPPAMQALLVTRTAREQWLRTPLFETAIAPMIGAVTPARFEF